VVVRTAEPHPVPFTPSRSLQPTCKCIVRSSSANQSVKTASPKAKLPFPTISNKEASPTPSSRHLELQSRCPCSSCEPACVRTRPACAKKDGMEPLHVALRLFTIDCSPIVRTDISSSGTHSSLSAKRSAIAPLSPTKQNHPSLSSHHSRMQPAENSSPRHSPQRSGTHLSLSTSFQCSALEDAGPRKRQVQSSPCVGLASEWICRASTSRVLPGSRALRCIVRSLC
jgi:hypothetical protein